MHAMSSAEAGTWALSASCALSNVEAGHEHSRFGFNYNKYRCYLPRLPVFSLAASLGAIFQPLIGEERDEEDFCILCYKDGKDHLKMEMEMEIPSVKASANSDIIFFFTSAQDGNKLLDDERLSLADDLKKAHDQNQNKSK
ncbi:hypothetical protein Tco_0587708 [Tanacetum coccineum]